MRPHVKILPAMAAAMLVTATGAAAAPSGTITEFSAGLNPEAAPNYIVAGSDGNLWFSDAGTTTAIGRITPSGAITEFSAGLAGPSPPSAITLGPDGNVWFTSCCTNSAIGRITPGGSIMEFTSLGAGVQPGSIASGADGNLWFTDCCVNMALGRITPSGSIAEYSTGLNPGSRPTSIAPGADGNLWFTDVGTTKAIGRITPGGSIMEFSVGLIPGYEPETIAPGPDGNMWFWDEGSTSAMGSITPSGSISLFSAGLGSGHDPEYIAPGADGNLWLTDNTGINAGVIGQFTLGGALNESFSGLNPEANPTVIAPGPDGNVWFTDFGKTHAIGRVAPEALPTPLAVSGSGAAGSPQLCSASWPTWSGQQPSATLYGFDGYRWLLDGVQVGTGPSYTPSAASIGHQLACSETATYPMLNVTRVAASAPVTVLAAPAAPGGPAAPVVTGAHESAKRWREGGRLAQVTRSRLKQKVPVGTTISFSLNEQATVSLSFTQRVAGRRVKGRCVAPSKSNRRKPTCKRTVTRGAISFAGHAGTNRVVFQGRISRSSKLKPGRYALVIVATNSSGQGSAPASLSFAIVK